MKIMYFSIIYFTTLACAVQGIRAMETNQESGTQTLNIIAAIKRFNQYQGTKYIYNGLDCQKKGSMLNGYEKFDPKKHEKFFKTLEHSLTMHGLYEEKSLIDANSPAIHITYLQQAFGKYFQIDELEKQVTALENNMQKPNGQSNKKTFFYGFALGGVTFFGLNSLYGYIWPRK